MKTLYEKIIEFAERDDCDGTMKMLKNGVDWDLAKKDVHGYTRDEKNELTNSLGFHAINILIKHLDHRAYYDADNRATIFLTPRNIGIVLNAATHKVSLCGLKRAILSQICLHEDKDRKGLGYKKELLQWMDLVFTIEELV